MKSKPKQFVYFRTLIGGAALLTSTAMFAEEVGAPPEIAVCAPAPEFVPVDIESPEEGFLVDEEVVEDVVDDAKISDDDTIVVDDSTGGDDATGDDEATDEEDPDLVICWDVDWVKRNNEEDESGNPLYYMSGNGPGIESQGGIASSSAPDAADEKSAVTSVDAKTVTPNIRRAVAKPTAVKVKGRVFLR